MKTSIQFVIGSTPLAAKPIRVRRGSAERKLAECHTDRIGVTDENGWAEVDLSEGVHALEI